MGGGSSIQIARVFGIRIGASPSWFFVLFFFIYTLSSYFSEDVVHGSDTQGYLLAVAAAGLFFTSLIMHELGHALVARRLGIDIHGIDLWFFGGVAKLSRDTESAGDEFKIAAAGPAVTAVVVAVCLGLAVLSGGGDVIDVARYRTVPDASPATALLGFLASINALLLLFNLVPAFPLDGGRIARSIAWRITGDRTKATVGAARVGQGFGLALVILGAYLLGSGDAIDGLYAGFIGWFLMSAARGAIVTSAFTERLEGITVADIMDTEPVTMPATTTLTQAQDEFFERYGWDWFPVVDATGRFLGLARQEAVEAEIAAGRPALAVADVLGGAEADGASIRADRPLEALLGDEQLRVRGALMAVDAEGVLRGVVTLDQVRRALAAALPSRLA